MVKSNSSVTIYMNIKNCNFGLKEEPRESKHDDDTIQLTFSEYK